MRWVLIAVAVIAVTGLIILMHFRNDSRGNMTGSCLYAYNPDGTQKWVADLGSDDFDGNVRLGSDGMIILTGWNYSDGSANSVVCAISPSGCELWRVNLKDHGFEDVTFQDLIVGDSGMIVGRIRQQGSQRQGSFEQHLLGVSNVGEVLFSFRLVEKEKYRPEKDIQVAPDGSVFYISSSEQHGVDALYRVTHGGKVTSFFRSQTISAFAFSPEGLVYVHCDYEQLRAFDIEGNLLWTLGIPANKPGPDFLIRAPDGRIIVSGLDDCLIAVSADGEHLFDYGTEEDVRVGCPAFAQNGTIYSTRRINIPEESSLYFDSIDTKGNTLWSFHVNPDNRDRGSVGRADPIIGPDGTVYLRCSYGIFRGEIWAFTLDGNNKWRLKTQGYDGTFIPGKGGHAYWYYRNNLSAIGADGQELWSLPIDATDRFYQSRTQPAATSDGTIYVYMNTEVDEARVRIS